MEVFLIAKEMYIPIITHLDSINGWYFIFQNPCQRTLPITVHIGLVRIWSSLPLSVWSCQVKHHSVFTTTTFTLSLSSLTLCSHLTCPSLNPFSCLGSKILPSWAQVQWPSCNLPWSSSSPLHLPFSDSDWRTVSHLLSCPGTYLLVSFVKLNFKFRAIWYTSTLISRVHSPSRAWHRIVAQ